MSKEELKDLKRRVMEADLTVNNPNIQIIYEDAVSKWVRSYEEKKEHNIGDYFGDIPDEIEFDGKNYTPHDILYNVTKRTDVGMKVLQHMQDHIDNNPLIEGESLNEIIAGSVPDDADLDEAKMIYGSKELTFRMLLESAINADVDCIFLNDGTFDAVLSLYGKPSPLRTKSKPSPSDFIYSIKGSIESSILQIKDTYENLTEGTKFLCYCKDENITKQDLESNEYPNLTKKWNELEEIRNKNTGFSIEKGIAIAFHYIKNRKKIKYMEDYAKTQFFNECEIEK